MRTSLLVLCAIIATSLSAQAAPKKKAAAPPPAAAKKAVPNVKVNTTVPGAEDQPAASEATAAPVRGPTRIDFDDRLIQGQTNKSGAVYLYDRKELKIRSMIKKRDNFRDEIVGSLYDS